MILSPQTIRKLYILDPCLEAGKFEGVSHGMSHAGYDLTLAEYHRIPARGFELASVLEKIRMPHDIVGVVHDKSTWGRRGLSVLNTVVEPGWIGYLTLELVNHTDRAIEVAPGMGIAQIIFHVLDRATDDPYSGKYQDQKAGPQPAIFEHDE